MFFKGIACFVISYLIGSLSPSIIISRCFFRTDVRTVGSGNAGATNMARTFGLLPGLLTLGCDFFKCLLAMFLSKLIAGPGGCIIAAFAALIGHCFPLYYGFRGGKGVVAASAIALLISWQGFVLFLVVFCFVMLLSQIVSLSSLCALLAIALFSVFVANSTALAVLGVFTCVLVFFMHRENIQRLLLGRENRLVLRSHASHR